MTFPASKAHAPALALSNALVGSPIRRLLAPSPPSQLPVTLGPTCFATNSLLLARRRRRDESPPTLRASTPRCHRPKRCPSRSDGAFSANSDQVDHELAALPVDQRGHADHEMAAGWIRETWPLKEIGKSPQGCRDFDSPGGYVACSTGDWEIGYDLQGAQGLEGYQFLAHELGHIWDNSYGSRNGWGDDRTAVEFENSQRYPGPYRNP